MFKPTRILVPTDMSDHSFRAMRLGFEIGSAYNAEVFLLHVFQSSGHDCVVDYCLPGDLLKSVEIELHELARKKLLEQLAMFPWIDASAVTTVVRTGNPYEVILSAAEELEIDLIVIGSLGSTGLSNYLMGGVARQVLLNAKCSVLLTK